MAGPLKTPSGGKGFRHRGSGPRKKGRLLQRPTPKGMLTSLAAAAARKTAKATTGGGGVAASGAAGEAQPSRARRVLSGAGRAAAMMGRRAFRAARRAAAKAAGHAIKAAIKACLASGVCAIAAAAAGAVVALMFLAAVAVIVLTGTPPSIPSVDGIVYDPAAHPLIGQPGAARPQSGQPGVALPPVEAAERFRDDDDRTLLNRLEYHPGRPLTAYDVETVVWYLGGGPVRTTGTDPCEYIEKHASVPIKPEYDSSQVRVASTGPEDGFFVPVVDCHTLAAAHAAFAAAAAMFADGSPPRLNTNWKSEPSTGIDVVDSIACSADSECRTRLREFVPHVYPPISYRYEVPVPTGSVTAFGVAFLRATRADGGAVPVVPVFARPQEITEPGAAGIEDCFPHSPYPQTAAGTLPLYTPSSGLAILHMTCPPPLTALGDDPLTNKNWEEVPALKAVHTALPCLRDPNVALPDKHEEYAAGPDNIDPDPDLVGAPKGVCNARYRQEAADAVNTLLGMRPVRRPPPGRLMRLLGASEGLLNAIGVLNEWGLTGPTEPAEWEPDFQEDARHSPTGRKGGDINREGEFDCHWYPAFWDCGRGDNSSRVLNGLLRAFGYVAPQPLVGTYQEKSGHLVDCPNREHETGITKNGVEMHAGVIVSLSDIGGDLLHRLPQRVGRGFAHLCVFDDLWVLDVLAEPTLKGVKQYCPNVVRDHGLHTCHEVWRSYQAQVNARKRRGCPDVFLSDPSDCVIVNDKGEEENIPVAQPGKSRHQIGMAVDYACWVTTSPCFKWLASLAGAGGMPLKNLCSSKSSRSSRQCPNPGEGDDFVYEAWHWSPDGR